MQATFYSLWSIGVYYYHYMSLLSIPPHMYIAGRPGATLRWLLLNKKKGSWPPGSAPTTPYRSQSLSVIGPSHTLHQPPQLPKPVHDWADWSNSAGDRWPQKLALHSCHHLPVPPPPPLTPLKDLHAAGPVLTLSFLHPPGNPQVSHATCFIGILIICIFYLYFDVCQAIYENHAPIYTMYLWYIGA